MNLDEKVLTYRVAANQGHVDAQYILGRMYEKGQGFSGEIVAALRAEAADWYRKAAERGTADARQRLDDFEHPEVAIHRLRSAAEQGDVNSQIRLGDWFSSGIPVPEDFTEAARWYRVAAEQGNIIAQYELGNMYLNGEGMRKDTVEAMKWFRMAADRGDPDSEFALGVICANGANPGSQDFNEAMRWCERAANRGNMDAKEMLNQMTTLNQAN